MIPPSFHRPAPRPRKSACPWLSGFFRERQGHASCDWCLNDFPASGVDVDHVRPLSLGGEDVDGNVQVLCRRCHGLKTRTEFEAVRGRELK
ncbi:HNH endonuclease signature motif containing protein [Streptomyces scopuliridis]|uniref:HNH endonuclease n=1 Tax=Streptomyces scopuliridis TaxID=452529 RepID=UPI002DDB0446|nr:HNH endonuclease signature motif containing protein [Streptomyces scopuliridis]